MSWLATIPLLLAVVLAGPKAMGWALSLYVCALCAAAGFLPWWLSLRLCWVRPAPVNSDFLSSCRWWLPPYLVVAADLRRT